jgi:phospholipid/cholesterol/gamma-HCH transport system substrate-binding protein
MLRRVALLSAVSLITLAAVVVFARTRASYEATVVLPSASNLVVGTPIQVDGRAAGTIRDVSASDGNALVKVSVDPSYAPLHDGTTARIRWNAVLGERILELLPGRPENPALPDGGLLVGAIAPVEFDDVLSAFDTPTRQHLTALIGQLDGTLNGHQQDLANTLRTAGPAVNALGRVLGGIGADTPAIEAVVTRLNQLTATVNERRGDVSGAVERLASMTTELAHRRAELRESLRELPSTLVAAQQTLDRVPAATDATAPLLNKLAPSIHQLPAIADDLAPLLRDLRPATSDLRPTLAAAKQLLGRTPDLLDGTHAVFPSLTETVDSSKDALAFLRPYTPELAGLFANWGSYASAVDGNGHYTRVLAPQGATSFVNNPGLMPPGIIRDRAPLPGAQEGQPWKDATGSGIR